MQLQRPGPARSPARAAHAAVIRSTRTLNWDDAFGRCEKPSGVGGDDWIDRLVARVDTFNAAHPNATTTLADVVSALKDRIVQPPEIGGYSPPLVAQVASSPPSTPERRSSGRDKSSLEVSRAFQGPGTQQRTLAAKRSTLSAREPASSIASTLESSTVGAGALPSARFLAPPTPGDEDGPVVKPFQRHLRFVPPATEASLLETLFGMPLNAAVSSATFETGAGAPLRAACGAYIKLPDFMLAGLDRGQRNEPPRLDVCPGGAACDYQALCEQLRPALAAEGHFTHCSVDTVQQQYFHMYTVLP